MFRCSLFLLFFLSSPLLAQMSVVDSTSSEEVTRLYKQYYCTVDTMESEWKGDFLSGDYGTTSQQYRQATLDRIYFYRALAGLDNHIELSESLTKKAQRAAYAISANNKMRTNGTAYLSAEEFEEQLVEDAIDRDPFKTYRYYFNALPNILAAGPVVHGSDLATGLFHTMRNKNRHDAHTAVHKDAFPVNRHRILAPDMSEVGIGTIELDTPHAMDSSSPRMKDYSSGVLTTNNNHSVDPSIFKPIVWPPAGYIPYSMVTHMWSAHIPGADMRTAYVTVRRTDLEGELAEPLRLTKLEHEEGDDIDKMAWQIHSSSVRNVFNLGKPVNHDTGLAEERRYQVVIGNISHNGSFRDYTYEVIEYNPSPTREGSRLHVRIPPKIRDHSRSFLQYKLFGADGCLFQSDGAWANKEALHVWLRYSTSPDGPFDSGVEGGGGANPDHIDRKSFKNGFYRYHFTTQRFTGVSGPFLLQEHDVHATSEVVQYSTTFGFRKLDEAFAEPIEAINVVEAHESIIGDAEEQASEEDLDEASLEELMDTFGILKKKKRRCRRRRRRGRCTTEKCKTRCKNIRTQFRDVKSRLS